jgi:hypothetical protein
MSATVFTPDSELRYAASGRIPADGEALQLDRNYRFAHLPLVNPDHPDVIAEEPERGYRMGLHATVRSLVVPIDLDALERSEPFRALLDEMRHGPLAPVIAWESFDRRRARLHATIVGNLPREAGSLEDIQQRIGGCGGPFRIALDGLFAGPINTGRLYLKLVPEWRGGRNFIDVLQRSFGRDPTGLYVVGLFNLTDHLPPERARHLGAALRRFGETRFLTSTVDELWVIDSRDDLVLDGEIVERIALSRTVP